MIVTGENTESIQLILTRMEGKLDRMGDRMDRYEQDVQGLRARLHDLSNELTPITMMDLRTRIHDADKREASVDKRIGDLELAEHRREGAAKLAKVLWAVFGAVGVGGVAAVATLLAKVIH